MKIEDLNYLRRFENNFYTAINANYTRMIPSRELDKMLEIYVNETNNKFPLCKHCTSSILSFLKSLGKIYNRAVEDEKITREKNIEKDEFHFKTEQNVKGRKRK